MKWCCMKNFYDINQGRKKGNCALLPTRSFRSALSVCFAVCTLRVNLPVIAEEKKRLRDPVGQASPANLICNQREDKFVGTTS